MTNQKWRLVKFSIHRGSENMAIDEAIFRLYDKLGINTIRFYGWKPSTVSIGKNQQVDREVNLEILNKMGFELVRRISGGGAVFHDTQGELTYSIVTNEKNLTGKSIQGSYYELAKIVFNPLEKLGLNLDYAQIHCPSVFSAGKKISGNAQARSGNVILQHGTILLKIHPEVMYSVLKAQPGRTRQSMVESVYQNITTLSERLNREFNQQELADYIIQNLIENNPAQYVLEDLRLEEVELLGDLSNKYELDEWNYSK
jgi:lipoate-protein ligase A